MTLFRGIFSFSLRIPMMAVTTKALASTAATKMTNSTIATALESTTAKSDASSTAISEAGAAIVVAGGRNSAAISSCWEAGEESEKLV